MSGRFELIRRFGELSPTHAGHAGVLSAPGALVAPSDIDEFVTSASAALSPSRHGEVMERALRFTCESADAPLELSFIGLYTALESALTYFRRQDNYHVLRPAEFARLERELKAWLRQHPLLEREDARRGLIYEKLRELNRFPFSHYSGDSASTTRWT